MAVADVTGTDAAVVGVDIGGTFTDVVCVMPDGRTTITKVPSTPAHLPDGVLTGLRQCLEMAGGEPASVGRFLHGTTVATNALLVGAGARVGLITTEGFEDVLEIGRQLRPREALYRLDPPAQTPVFLAPRRRRIGVAERVTANGEVLRPLDEDDVRRAAHRLVDEEGVTAIAVTLLFSFARPDHEKRVREILGEEFPDVDVSLSCEVDPVFREYERTCMACTDAYVRPVVQRYIADLGSGLRAMGVGADLMVMQSRGALTGAENALRRPVSLVASGPAAGVLGALGAARACGVTEALTIDIGGTSSDVGIIRRGALALGRGEVVRGFPLRMTAVDVSSIGAGGGSIAWIDGGGTLRVGPASAGSSPGPACYGRGGDRPTVTDASLVLGYLNPGYFAGGGLGLDVERAHAVVGALGEHLGLGALETALGIHRIVNAHMAAQMRLSSTIRGHDPRSLALVVLGGAGPVHGAQLADELKMGRVIVPPAPGVLAAWGLTAAEIEHEVARTFAAPADASAGEELVNVYADLRRDVLELMAAEGTDVDAVLLRHSADLRYVGQSYELEVTVPETDGAEIVHAALEGLHERHLAIYGYVDQEAPVEFMNLRVTATLSAADIARPEIHTRDSDGVVRKPSRTIHTSTSPEGCEAVIYERHSLPVGFSLEGPAILEQEDTTTVVYPGWTALVHDSGTVLLERSESHG